MTVRPEPGQRLPELVWVSRLVIIEEAEALRSALDEYSSSPQPGCPYELDSKAWSNAPAPQTEARRSLLDLTQHQAVLIYINAYDHMQTLGRALGGDGATTLFSHVSLSRVVCEAAVRFAWALDPAVSAEERIVRGAVLLLTSAEERLKGATGLPADRFGTRVHQALIRNCTQERDSVRGMIERAGVRLVWDRKGKRIVRLQLDSPLVDVPVDLNVTQLMGIFLPDSPGWYRPGSSVTHSLYWGLRDAIGSAPGEPLALTPPLAEVGAAAESAISASGLILTHAAGYYGHDPRSRVERTKARREAVDLRMRRLARYGAGSVQVVVTPP
jgi:hypothetical protein